MTGTLKGTINFTTLQILIGPVLTDRTAFAGGAVDPRVSGMCP